MEAHPVNRQEQDILVVAKGGGVAFIGAIATRGLGYLYILALIWMLGAEAFGNLTLALAIALFVGTVSSIGLPNGVVRYGTINDQSRGKAGVHQTTLAAIRVGVPVGVLSMAVLLWSSSTIAESVFHKPELTGMLGILALGVPFMSLQSTLLAGTRALKIMSYSTIVWMVQPLVALLFAIPMIYLGLGANGAALAYASSFVCGAALALYFYLRLIPREDRRGERFAPGQMIRFSLPLSMTEWMHFANQRTEIFFLGLLPGAVDISIYKIAWSLAGLMTMLRQSLEQILSPFISDLSHRRELSQLETLYKATAKWGFTCALIIFVIYTLFAREIMGVFDPRLVAGAGVLVALGLAQLFNELTGPCNTILFMSGRSDLTLVNTVIAFVSSIVLDWLLIPRYGLTGAAIAGASAIVFVNVLRVIEVWWSLHIHPFKVSFLKAVAAGVLVASAIVAYRTYGFSGSLIVDLGTIPLFCLLYLALILLLKVDLEDLVVITAIRRRVLFRSRA